MAYLCLTIPSYQLRWSSLEDISTPASLMAIYKPRLSLRQPPKLTLSLLFTTHESETRPSWHRLSQSQLPRITAHKLMWRRGKARLPTADRTTPTDSVNLTRTRISCIVKQVMRLPISGDVRCRCVQLKDRTAPLLSEYQTILFLDLHKLHIHIIHYTTSQDGTQPSNCCIGV
jgi:hypothetical protein